MTQAQQQTDGAHQQANEQRGDGQRQLTTAQCENQRRIQRAQEDGWRTQQDGEAQADSIRNQATQNKNDRISQPMTN